MIGDVIDSFRNITPAVNQEFVRKSPKNSQSFIFEKLICQSYFSGHANFLPNV